MESMEMNELFWRGKRVFLTGHTGFKGSWLSLWLQSMGTELTGFALVPPTQPSLFEIAKVGEGMRSFEGDIRHIEALQAALAESRPEIVIHMAAQPLVRYSYEYPVETYATNVMGTIHLLESLRKVDTVRAIVNVTTDKCYENREWAWGYRENEAMGGYDPYSNSKACAELVTAAYRSSFFNPERHAEHGVALASARAGNVIGGGDWAQDRLIPDIVNAFSQGRTVSIRNPQAIRPWQHVMEPLRGYLMLAERLYEQGAAFAEGWNFGPNDIDAKPVEWIVRKLANKWGEGARWKVEQDAALHEANYLKLDISKARAQLGWEPQLNLDEALGLIVDWYREYNNQTDMRALVLQQLAMYNSLSGKDVDE